MFVVVRVVFRYEFVIFVVYVLVVRVVVYVDFDLVLFVLII